MTKTVPPSTSAIVQAANKAFLSQHGYLPSFKKRLRITPAPHGSGYTDTSINHDQVLAAQPSASQP